MPAIANDNVGALFMSDTILEAELTAPLRTAYRQKNRDEREWLPGQWSYSDANGQRVTHDVSIRTRGVFRRANCRLPPLRLNFKKGQGDGTLFAGQDKLKLVSPCKHGDASQQHIMLEYLAYRALNVLTDDSLKVRLVRLNYVDSDGKVKPWSDLTFLIEHEKALAKRRNMKAHHAPALKTCQLDLQKTAIVELFQLLIANHDFSTIRGPEGSDCCHNMEVLAPPDATEGFIPVPYDFDASGLVNTGYAAPPEALKIRNVRTRYFRGRCKPDEMWTEAFALFQSKRGEIFNVFANSTELSGRYKKKTLAYINDFYKILDDPRRVQREIIGRCYGGS